MWLLGCMTFLVMGSCMAQEKTFKEVVKKTIPMQNTSQNALVVKNVSGSITEEAFSGDEVVVEVKKEIWARTNKNLEFGKEETSQSKRLGSIG